MKLSYSKYSGAGNNFILFDNRRNYFPADQKDLIVALCSRENVAGKSVTGKNVTGKNAIRESVDGVLLLESSSDCDFAMRIFNRDGSHAQMCGNGLRCLIRFLEELGIWQSEYCIGTDAGPLKGRSRGELIEVDMPAPHSFRFDLAASVGAEMITPQVTLQVILHYLNTGVPHAVVFCDSIEPVRVEELGREIRFSPLFAPEGTNVTFAALKGHGLDIRTFERGVEGETLACGTGAVAASIAAAKKYGLESPVTVRVRSKENLIVSFQKKGESG